MKKDEAELFLADYRAVLKRWSMTSAGLQAGDAPLMFEQLKQGLDTLTEIGAAYPEFAYSVDLISNALTRELPDQHARSLRPDDISYR